MFLSMECFLVKSALKTILALKNAGILSLSLEKYLNFTIFA